MTQSSTTFMPRSAHEPHGASARFTFNRALAALVSAGLLALGGCASTPNPTGEMATARAAVDNARRAGAGQLAEAEMAEAQDRITFAERAHAAKEYESARRAAEQARGLRNWRRRRPASPRPGRRRPNWTTR